MKHSSVEIKSKRRIKGACAGVVGNILDVSCCLAAGEERQMQAACGTTATAFELYLVFCQVLGQK